MNNVDKIKLFSYTSLIGAAFIAAALSGCTDNQSAKVFGGTTNITLVCDQKLENITWKEANIWFLTRPMRESETPETHTLKERKIKGVFEG